MTFDEYYDAEEVVDNIVFSMNKHLSKIVSTVANTVADTIFRESEEAGYAMNTTREILVSLIFSQLLEVYYARAARDLLS